MLFASSNETERKKCKKQANEYDDGFGNKSNTYIFSYQLQ